MELAMFGCVLLAVVVGLLLILRWTREREFDGTRQIPSVSGIPYVMNMLKLYRKYFSDRQYYLRPVDYLLPMVEGLSKLFYKEKIVKMGWGPRTFIFCFEPTISENIFNSSAAMEKDGVYKILHSFLGTGLVTSGGEKWRIRRKMLTPAFHFGIMKDFLAIFNDQSNILIGKLQKLSGQEIDISDAIALCSLSIVGESATGVQLRAQDGETLPYAQVVKNLTEFFVELILTPWYWIPPIFYLSSTGKAVRNSRIIFHGFSRKVIEERKRTFLEMKSRELDETFKEDKGPGTKKRQIFLDILLYHHISTGSLSMEDIREEVDTFISAGYDTVSVGISWALYLLGLHQDIQEKLFQEMSRIFDGDKARSATIKDLREMKYLECIIKESLRLYPSTPIIARRTTGDIEAGDYVVPANSSVVILIYSIHRDPAFFPNPEVFDPNRFLPENCKERHPFAYVPFSAGRRNCIGQRFAMMELKSVVSSVVRNFKIHSLDSRDKLILSGDFILRARKAPRLILEKR